MFTKRFNALQQLTLNDESQNKEMLSWINLVGLTAWSKTPKPPVQWQKLILNVSPGNKEN